MSELRFSDGVTFETSGPYRTTSRYDGWYVVGGGMMCPVESEAAGKALIARLNRGKSQAKP